MMKRRPGRPKGTCKRIHRIVSTITLYRENWKFLDSIGSSRGKAIDKLIAFYKSKHVD